MPSFYLPSRYSDTLNNLTIAIDTSGSMTDEFLVEILTEIQYINETLKPQNLTVLDCDSRIHNIHHVTDSSSILEYEFTGGGGTSFKPVIKYCNENDTNLLVYFTDLEAQQITDEQPFPIIWVCSTDHAPAPIGETIYVHN
jgi:predicted metal-dependent peptidase